MTPIFSGNRDNSQPSPSQLASLPTRLSDWRLSPNGEAFAYGGDEVDLSVWNTELAFQHKQENGTSVSTENTKKRKRGDALFPAETWRAKNVSFTRRLRTLYSHVSRSPMIPLVFVNRFRLILSRSCHLLLPPSTS
jgi:hypothetical protein